MRGVAAASLTLIIAIAVTTSLTILGLNLGGGHATSKDVVRGEVSSVNHVLNQVVVNGTVVRFAGTWRCSGVKGNLTASQLLNLIRPGEPVEIVAAHGILSLKAVKAYLPGGTVCYLAGTHPAGRG